MANIDTDALSVVAQNLLGDGHIVHSRIVLGVTENEPFSEQIRRVDHCPLYNEGVSGEPSPEQRLDEWLIGYRKSCQYKIRAGSGWAVESELRWVVHRHT